MTDIKETPWAVVCSAHGKICLTVDQYDTQLAQASARWVCPKCQEYADWDDDHDEFADYE